MGVVELRHAVGRLVADRHGQGGGAVIGVVTGDHVLFVRLAAAVLVVLDQPVGGIDRRRAAGGEEHMIEIARSEAGEFCAQFDSDVVGHVRKRVGIGQLAHLVGDGQGHFLAAQADVGAPHAADGIEEAVAVGVTNVGALTGDDVQRTLLAVLVEHMVAVHVVGLVGLHQRVVGDSECFAWGGHGQLLGGNRWAVFRNRS
ncbi:hypothetical protein D3C80_1375100 [compost metagenome]